MAITWEQIARRIRRLEKLDKGLALEDVLLRKDYLHENPLLYAQTQAYLRAIRDALAGVEAARVVLARRGSGTGTRRRERPRSECPRRGRLPLGLA